jgi:hypothetical protein
MSDQFITLAKAIELTTQYRTNKDTILDPKYRDSEIMPVCETFNRSAIEDLLSQGCVQIRVYFGMSLDLKIRLIIVGVNAQGEDMLPPGGTSLDTDYYIVEDGIRCPVTCPPPSPLNGE